MPMHVHIDTPLPIQVGNQEYSLITFEDLYNKCLEDTKLFPRMAEDPNKLGDILLALKLVLPEKCFMQLKHLLNDPFLCKLAERYLKEGKPWPTRRIAFWGDQKSEEFRAPCTWPNCPSD